MGSGFAAISERAKQRFFHVVFLTDNILSCTYIFLTYRYNASHLNLLKEE